MTSESGIEWLHGQSSGTIDTYFYLLQWLTIATDDMTC